MIKSCYQKQIANTGNNYMLNGNLMEVCRSKGDGGEGGLCTC